MTDDNGSPDAVTIERRFDAPVDLIWQMWTDPEHFTAWYGPDGAAGPRRQDGRARRRHPTGVHEDANTERPDPSDLWVAGRRHAVGQRR
jgi:uncharacterized protein YndB with AHSA1/START domain